MKKSALNVVIVSTPLALMLGGCIGEPSEFRLAPVGGGGSSGGSFMDYWQGRTVQPRPAPAQTAPPTGATGLSRVESEPTPESAPSAEPAPQEIPRAVPPPAFEDIPGVVEYHPVSSPAQCRQMVDFLKSQGLRVELSKVIPINQPGRRGRARAPSKRVPGRRDRSSSYGSSYICEIVGLDTVAGRYAVGQDYMDSGMDVPDFDKETHPNDYRPGRNSVEPPADPNNPNRRTVPDVDPANRPDYDNLPF